jgi:transcriptional regulator with GAF, ATPase, and Fis domain
MFEETEHLTDPEPILGESRFSGIVFPMSGGDSLSVRMAETARKLQDLQGDTEATVRLAVQLAQTNIQGCDGAGLAFVSSRKVVETMAATNQMVVDAARLQQELKEGPCLDAIWKEQVVYSPSLAYDHRWPTWGPRAVAETDARSVLSFQLFTHGDTLGALNLYSHSLDAFDQDARDEGTAIAAHIAIAVAASEQIQQLSIGLDTRTVIGQATGLLMERFDLDAARAFSVLARLSSQSNTKLRSVAMELVANRHHRDLDLGSRSPGETA